MYKYEKILKVLPEDKWLFPSEIKRIAKRELGMEKTETGAVMHTDGFLNKMEKKKIGRGTYRYKRLDDGRD